MSGLVSGITKVFTSIGTGVAKLGSAVRGAGATLFTAGAATGSGLTSAATQGGPLSGLLGGGGALGNVLSGAIKQGLSGGLIGGAVGSLTGEGFAKGFKQGGIVGAIGGGLGSFFSPAAVAGGDPGVDPTTTGSIVPAESPTGAAPGGVGLGRFGGGSSGAGKGFGGIVESRYNPGASATTVPTVPITGGGGGAATEGGWKGLGDFLNTNAGSGLIGGIGDALTKEREIEALMEAREADRKFLRDKEQRITDSYVGSGEAMAGSQPWAGDPTPRPTPAAKWAYNPNTGMIDMTA
jgi:hypothetical protein